MRYLCVLQSLLLMLLFVPAQSFAPSVDDIITYHSKDMWYPGKGLTPGDSFVYVVCDNMRKFAEYDDDDNNNNDDDHCYNIRLDFYFEMISGNNDVWVVQAEIAQNSNSTRHHIFLINSDTLDITTDSAGSEFADSVEDTVFYLVQFAYKESPKHLSVGSTWGGAISSFNQESDVIVSSVESVIIPNGSTADAYVIRYGILNPSIFMVSSVIPFPIYAVSSNPHFISSDPAVTFTLELQDYSLGYTSKKTTEKMTEND